MGSIQQEFNGNVQEGQVVTILVTGFGPFLARYPVNPATEITQLLPDYLPSTERHKIAVRIIAYPTPIRVSFDGVRDLIPSLLKTYRGSIDMVLHIGMASERKHYCLERYARRDGYIKGKDLDGKMPSPDDGRILFGDCPQIMMTSLDFDSVILNWRINILGIPEGHPGAAADARPSDDAGRYICDYLYFNSLVYYGRENDSMEGGKCTDRPVLFFHVPPQSDEKCLQNGRAIAIALIRAMADSLTRDRERAVLAAT